MTEMKIGSVVRLKSGGPPMTVTGFEMRDKRTQGNGECALCGPYPNMDSSEATVMATMQLAQQTWKSRHDAHVKLTPDMYVAVAWMNFGSGDARDAVFPADALVVLSDVEMQGMFAPLVGQAIGPAPGFGAHERRVCGPFDDEPPPWPRRRRGRYRRVRVRDFEDD